MFFFTHLASHSFHSACCIQRTRTPLLAVGVRVSWEAKARMKRYVTPSRVKKGANIPFSWRKWPLRAQIHVQLGPRSASWPGQVTWILLWVGHFLAYWPRLGPTLAPNLDLGANPGPDRGQEASKWRQNLILATIRPRDRASGASFWAPNLLSRG